MSIINHKRKRITKKFTLPSKVDLTNAKDADINTIVNRFLKKGVPLPIRGQGIYADVSEVPDLDQALTQINKAQSAFNELPSEIRKRFGNSPLEMIKFIQDPKNIDEGRKLGLFKPLENVQHSQGNKPQSGALAQNNDTTKAKIERKTTTINDDE